MPLKILADENIDYRIVKESTTILLTEDSDFGEWVFVHKEKLSVIFIRYMPAELTLIIDSLVSTLTRYGTSLAGKFVTLTATKIRIRDVLK